MQEAWVRFLSQEDPLEKEMANHSSILAWKIPWMEEPGRLQSIGSQRVAHGRVTSLSLSNTMHKDKLKMDLIPTYKIKNYKTLRGKHRQNSQ